MITARYVWNKTPSIPCFSCNSAVMPYGQYCMPYSSSAWNWDIALTPVSGEAAEPMSSIMPAPFVPYHRSVTEIFIPSILLGSMCIAVACFVYMFWVSFENEKTLDCRKS